LDLLPRLIGGTVRAVAILAALSSAACNTTSKSVDDILAERAAKRAERLAELESKYGKCRGDRWQSVSVIGKTTSTELVNQLRACNLTYADYDTSRHVSASREHFFVHIGTDRIWHFVNGVLVSYRT
jgi:hypothetical protein